MTSRNRLDPVSLDDYDLREPLGAGAMARVFDAVHRRSGANVAIKLLDAAQRGSRELRERMAREAVLLASVSSPHVSRLLGYGWDNDQPFLVLERLEGETLADVLRRDGRVDTAHLVNWVEQLLLGARDCHRANVIHRDIKPANIFIEAAPGGGEPTVQLIDFGVARLNEIASAGISITTSHHLIGSMGYMAPEQLEYAKGVGPTADLYAIGVVIFRCVSGRLPFVAKSFQALTKLKCEATAPLLSSMPGVNRDGFLDAFVAKALTRDPAARFASATEMLDEWWPVVASLDQDAPLPEIDVVFDEDDFVNTIAESLTRSGSYATAPGSSRPSSGPSVRTMDDMEATDPEMTRPTETSISAAPKTEPPSD